MQALLGMLDLERRWPIGDRDPIRHWCKGRVTLLGDAAHPTLQSFAQGACMAIEDARVPGRVHRLGARGLRGGVPALSGGPPAAHRPHPARVADRSGTFYHLGGIARDVRNDTCRRWSDEDVFRCLAWIYDGFALPTESGASAAAPARDRMLAGSAV